MITDALAFVVDVLFTLFILAALVLGAGIGVLSARRRGWLDELFILYSSWESAWNERKLEGSLYGSNDRAWRFWEQARIALPSLLRATATSFCTTSSTRKSSTHIVISTLGKKASAYSLFAYSSR